MLWAASCIGGELLMQPFHGSAAEGAAKSEVLQLAIVLEG